MPANKNAGSLPQATAPAAPIRTEDWAEQLEHTHPIQRREPFLAKEIEILKPLRTKPYKAPVAHNFKLFLIALQSLGRVSSRLRLNSLPGCSS